MQGCGELHVGEAAMVISGAVEGSVNGGVVIMFSEKLRGCVKEWKRESEGLMKVRLMVDGLPWYRCTLQQMIVEKSGRIVSMRVYRR